MEKTKIILPKQTRYEQPVEPAMSLSYTANDNQATKKPLADPRGSERSVVFATDIGTFSQIKPVEFPE